MVHELLARPVVAVDASLVASAVAGSRESQVSIWDALIIRAAEVAGLMPRPPRDRAGRSPP